MHHRFPSGQVKSADEVYAPGQPHPQGLPIWSSMPRLATFVRHEFWHAAGVPLRAS